jgi:hypothetical protein
MKVFISWSGEASGRVARSLRSFLQDVNQQIDPWLSKTDLAAGVRWSNELAKSLDETDFGIICLTQEALESPWLLFEAGALSKSLEYGRVCPYLINIQQAELTGPLSQFQSKPANREGAFELLTAINESLEARKLPMDRLSKYFDRFWSELEATLLQVTSTVSPIVIAADPSKMDEILFG